MKLYKKIFYDLLSCPFRLKHWCAYKGVFLTDNEKRLFLLNNRHKDKRCFIIGNGPSLNKMDLRPLGNEVTFGVNAVFYAFPKMGFVPTYYVVEDRLPAEDNKRVLNTLTGTTKIFPEDLRYCLRSSTDTIFINFYRYYSDFPEQGFPIFSKNLLKGVYWGGTVTYLNLQLAYYMGFKEVYLIGMDMNYSVPDYAKDNMITSRDKDMNHFHPDYFGPGKRWHQPNVERMLHALKHTKYIFERNGRKIFNATIGGELEIFPRVNYHNLFKRSL